VTRPSCPARVRPLWFLGVPIGLLGILLGAGCGSSGSRAATQPAPHESTYSKGTFASIPRYPGSSSTGPRNYKNGVTVQSFEVSSATPRTVLTWYQSRLSSSWELIRRPQASGSADWRGEWQQSKRRLLVSAAPSPGLGNDASAAATTQFSLELGDAGVSVSGSSSGSSGS
jgi:hypothetical protein